MNERYYINDENMGKLLFQTALGFRFTQDTPILPDVWEGYALDPNGRQDLIISPKHGVAAGKVAKYLRSAVRVHGKREQTRIAYIPGRIVANLTFDQMLKVILPVTKWWKDEFASRLEHPEQFTSPSDDNEKIEKTAAADKPVSRKLLNLTEKDVFKNLEIYRLKYEGTLDNKQEEGEYKLDTFTVMPPDAIWLLRLVGLIKMTQRPVVPEKPKNKHKKAWGNYLDWLDEDEFQISETSNNANISANEKFNNILNYYFLDEDQKRNASELLNSQEREALCQKFSWRIAACVKSVLVEREIELESIKAKLASKDPTDEKRFEKGIQGAEEFQNLISSAPAFIWSVTNNRDAESCVFESRMAIKADAASLLFEIDCSKITWAVIDSGINAYHPAFRKNKDIESAAESAIASESDPKKIAEAKIKNSRIVETLDFRGIRDFLDEDFAKDISAIKTLKKGTSQEIRNLLERFSDKNDGDFDKGKKQLLDLLGEIKTRLKRGLDIDWEDMEELIHVKIPKAPQNVHGTHVAGILGADWVHTEEVRKINKVDDGTEPEDQKIQKTTHVRGICPDINMIDVRVLRDDGKSDEFEVMAALQYLRYRNMQAGSIRIHGANLSLSLPHNVKNYACGSTPICQECERSVANGITVVTVAGNDGYSFGKRKKSYKVGYNGASIADPGNAESVITVGATHRSRPHQYGVSYFSSRGPTGDGRVKPDLVAPGEKIWGPTGSNSLTRKDGTSMAAPHVSGAAALLMARNKEFIGNPGKIKKILCESATDLGREKYYQGHGMLDILRAMQSI